MWTIYTPAEREETSIVVSAVCKTSCPLRLDSIVCAMGSDEEIVTRSVAGLGKTEKELSALMVFISAGALSSSLLSLKVEGAEDEFDAAGAM